MAYADNRAATNHRVLAAGVVALLQGAAIVALVNGLAVTFIPKADDPPLSGEQIYLPPPPPPPPTSTDKPKTRPDETIADQRLTAPPVVIQPPVGGPLVDPVGPADPGPITPGGGTIGGGGEANPPVGPRFTPRSARPRNDPASWVGPADMPYRDITEGHQGAVRVQLDIGSDGRVGACRVVSSSGFASLDAAACTAVSRRARFEPARDGDGQKTIGTYATTVRWVIPD